MKRLFLVGVALLAPRPASADVVPPPGDCANKKPGQACKDESGKAGACGTITYTKTFAPPFPDASPSTSQQSYFGCRGGDAPTAGPDSGKKCSVGIVGSAESSLLPLAAAAAVVALRRRRR